MPDLVYRRPNPVDVQQPNFLPVRYAAAGWRPPVCSPLSKLDFGLDSIWGGLRIGVQKPNLDIHFQWLTPMGNNINGSLDDSDWSVRRAHLQLVAIGTAVE